MYMYVTVSGKIPHSIKNQILLLMSELQVSIYNNCTISELQHFVTQPLIIIVNIECGKLSRAHNNRKCCTYNRKCWIFADLVTYTSCYSFFFAKLYNWSTKRKSCHVYWEDRTEFTNKHSN